MNLSTQLLALPQLQSGLLHMSGFRTSTFLRSNRHRSITSDPSIPTHTAQNHIPADRTDCWMFMQCSEDRPEASAISNCFYCHLHLEADRETEDREVHSRIVLPICRHSYSVFAPSSRNNLVDSSRDEQQQMRYGQNGKEELRVREVWNRGHTRTGQEKDSSIQCCMWCPN